jgi:hypothetical protein
MSKYTAIQPTYCAECGLHVRNRTVAEDVCLKDGKKCIDKRDIGANSNAAYKCKDFTEMPNDL